MTDFFVSYTRADRSWAEWVAWTLEDAGYTTIIEAWDFRPGNNFALEMQRATVAAERTIAVLSPDYFQSGFGASEWAAAFAQDPEGIKRKLIPVRVREGTIEGLLKTVIYVDFVGADEKDARKRLLSAARVDRAKPQRKPQFPGVTAGGAPPPKFPGAGDQSVPAKRAYAPNIRGVLTDLDRREFVHRSFEVIRSYFQDGLAALEKQHTGIKVDMMAINPASFSCEVFVHGKSRANCRVWEGRGYHSSNSIGYAEGSAAHNENTLNEQLLISENGQRLLWNATMNMGIGTRGLESSAMSSEAAAEYLWRRFCWNLES
jgi:hypothetical protein